MQCRACLKTDCESTTKLDEFNVLCFNLITNLNIQLGDDMPQQLCKNCTKDLKFCIAFRDKCISSNSVLSQKVVNEKLYSNEIKIEHLESNCDIQNELQKAEIFFTKAEAHSDKEAFFKEESLSNEDQFHDCFQNDIDDEFQLGNNKNLGIFKKSKSRPKKDKVIKRETKISDEDIKKYECGLCLDTLDEDKLYEHVSSHKQSSYCDVCSKHFASWPMLLVHRAEHLTGRSFACHICLKRFRLTLSLQNHYNTKHLDNTVNNLLQCSECNKIYDTVVSLQKHIWALHGSKTFKCDKCSLEFPYKRLFDYHRARKHAEQTMLYCDQCDYKNIFPSNLKQHKIRMHSSERVSCGACGAALADRAALERHRCAGRRPQVCPVCGKILEKNSRLAHHLSTHTEERRHKCDRCPAAYKSRAALRVHADRHDGVRRYTCDRCPQAFTQQSSLIRHRRLHTGKKPYVCKFCSKGFTDGYNLKVHMRVHGKNLIKKKNSDPEHSRGIQE